MAYIKRQRSYFIGMLLILGLSLALVSALLGAYFLVSMVTIRRGSGKPIHAYALFIDEKGAPYAGIVFVFSPENNRIGGIVVPPNMGLRETPTRDPYALSEHYARGGRRRVESALKNTFQVSFDFHAVIGPKNLRNIVDLIGGVYAYIFEPVEINDAENNLYISFLKGEYLLDGSKTVDFLRYSHMDHREYERLNRFEDVILTIAIAFANQSTLRRIFDTFDFRRALLKELRSNLRLADLKAIAQTITKIDPDFFFLERMYGTPSPNDPSVLLPLYDGRRPVQQIRELARKASGHAPNAGTTREDVKLRALNATDVSGLADRVKIRMNYRGFISTEYGNFGSIEENSFVLVQSGMPAKGFLVDEEAMTGRIYAYTDRAILIDVTLVMGQDYHEIDQ